MKKQTVTATVVTFLTLVASSPVLAQGIYLGARAGVSRSNTTLRIQGVQPKDVMGLTNGAGGILAGYAFGPMIAVQAELLWSSEGFKTPNNSPVAVPHQTDTVRVLDWRLNYVNLPLTIVATIPAESNFKLRLMGGVSFGFEASCKVKIVNLPAGSERNCDANRPTTTKKVYVGIPVSAGMGFAVGPAQRTQFFFDLGLTTGLTNQSDAGAGADLNDISFKSNTITATFGVSFLLGG